MREVPVLGGILLVAVLSLMPAEAQEAKRKGAVSRANGPRKGPPPGSTQAPAQQGMKKGYKPNPAPSNKPEPGGSVTTHFLPETSVYANSGRWTAYEDGIYLDPQQDAVYIVATSPGGALSGEKPDAISLFTAEIFGKYRSYANQTCPTTIEERLKDPGFRNRLEQQYEQARQSQQDILHKTLSFDEYVERMPDCDVGGNLWRQATRFADIDPALGVKRLLVRFPNDLEIRSFLSSDPGENYLPLLKARLLRENKIIRSPLAPAEEPEPRAEANANG